MEIDIKTILYLGTIIMLTLSTAVILIFYFLYSNLIQTTDYQKNCTQQQVSAIAGNE